MNLNKLFYMGLSNRLQSPAGDEGSDDGMTGDPTPKLEDAPAEKLEDDTLLKEVMAKKQRIKELTESDSVKSKQLEEIQNKLKSYDGIDVDLFKQMVQERKERQEQELEGKGDWASLKQSLSEQYESEKQQIIELQRQEADKKVGEVSTKYDDLVSKYQKAEGVIEELTIGSAFSSSRYVSDDLIPSSAKIRKLYGDHFDVVEGQVQAFDNPRGASKRNILVDANGKPLNFESALTKIVESDPDKDTILRAKENLGTNSDSNGRRGENDTTQAFGLSRIRVGLDAGNS